jgi:hypothetical protein
LTISYLPDRSNPSRFATAAVASSDIQPSNGVVHVLAISIAGNIGEVPTDFEANMFGFNDDFYKDVILSR